MDFKLQHIKAGGFKHDRGQRHVPEGGSPGIKVLSPVEAETYIKRLHPKRAFQKVHFDLRSSEADMESCQNGRRRKANSARVMETGAPCWSVI